MTDWSLMYISPAIANILILLGVIQGSILAILVLFSKRPSKPTRLFLATFLLILVYNGIETLNWSAKLNIGLFDVLGYTLIWGIGPSFYLYVCSFDTQHPIPWQKARWHFAPMVGKLFLNLSIVGWAVTHRDLSKIGTPAFDNNWFLFSDIAEWISVLLASTYCVWAWRKFQTLPDQPTTEWQVIRQWLKRFLVFFSGFCAFWLVTVIQLQFFGNYASAHYYPIEIALVLGIYWIGFGSYHNTRFVANDSPKISTFLDDFSEQTITDCLATIHQAMSDEQLYLNPTLSVSDLAKHIGFPPKLISAVLNQRLQKSFIELVNEHRVAEVQRRLLSADSQHLTISGIALESGFNSQATFQRVFKNMTQQTPKEFIQTMKNSSQNPI
ncbi:MAG: helix-turn-helix domain-containing protein [Spirosomataceae bacterium]